MKFNQFFPKTTVDLWCKLQFCDAYSLFWRLNCRYLPHTSQSIIRYRSYHWVISRNFAWWKKVLQQDGGKRIQREFREKDNWSPFVILSSSHFQKYWLLFRACKAFIVSREWTVVRVDQTKNTGWGSEWYNTLVSSDVVITCNLC